MLKLWKTGRVVLGLAFSVVIRESLSLDTML